MTRHTIDPIAREADYLADQSRQERTAIAWAAVDWKEKWPNYCHACKGWGGRDFSQSHPYGSTAASETLFDPCDEKDENTCHRCGESAMAGVSDVDLGTCSKCGWIPGTDGIPRR